VRVGNKGLDIIKEAEGLRLKAYLCPAKVWTIGFGHTKGVKEGDTCTISQADAWLREDCQEAEEAVARLITAPLTQEQFDALVSFTFNLGATNLRNSTLLKRLNALDYDSAADELLKWVKAGGVTLAGLVKRRAKERELFLCSSTSPRASGSSACSSGP
jgi:lysozyme